MKREMIVRIADGADLRHHGNAVERIVSPYNKCRAASFLFVSRLRVEVNPNNIA
jgi:hypothetical protein